MTSKAGLKCSWMVEPSTASAKSGFGCCNVCKESAEWSWRGLVVLHRSRGLRCSRYWHWWIIVDQEVIILVIIVIVARQILEFLVAALETHECTSASPYHGCPDVYVKAEALHSKLTMTPFDCVTIEARGTSEARNDEALKTGGAVRRRYVASIYTGGNFSRLFEFSVCFGASFRYVQYFGGLSPLHTRGNVEPF